MYNNISTYSHILRRDQHPQMYVTCQFSNFALKQRNWPAEFNVVDLLSHLSEFGYRTKSFRYPISHAQSQTTR